MHAGADILGYVDSSEFPEACGNSGLLKMVVNSVANWSVLKDPSLDLVWAFNK